MKYKVEYLEGEIVHHKFSENQYYVVGYYIKYGILIYVCKDIDDKEIYINGKALKKNKETTNFLTITK